MRYGDHRLFLYDNEIELVISTDGVLLENRPMNLKKLQAHKGLTNEIYFTIRDRDRKLQNVYSQRIMVYVIDPVSRRRVFSKLVETTDERGRIKMTLLPGDLTGISPGTYHMYVTRSTHTMGDTMMHIVATDATTSIQYDLPEDLAILPEGSYNIDVAKTVRGTIDVYPVYCDQDNNIRFDLEITDQAGAEPVPTQRTTRFAQTENTALGANANIFVSMPFQGNQTFNFVHAQHTIAVYTDTYTGNIRVQASCMPTAPADNGHEWFDVTTMALSNVSGISYHTFRVNTNWVRIQHTPDDANSVITEVLLRN